MSKEKSLVNWLKPQIKNNKILQFIKYFIDSLKIVL